MSGTPYITERHLAGMWERAAVPGARKVTVDGRKVRILYPGRRNDEPGADYRDAVIAVGGERRSGNIELHVRSADWTSHGHHRDPAYNGVILHVVMHHDGENTTSLQNGDRVPVVVLAGRRSVNRPEGAVCPAAGAAQESGVLLDHAGDARFEEKSAAFAAELRHEEAGQCLYRGIMAALGYTRNQDAFRKLADRVPLSRLVETQREQGVVSVEAMLLGAAGFLPSQRLDREQSPDSYTEELEGAWLECGLLETFPASPWRLTCVRPANYPPRRLAGMARLIRQYSGVGLLDCLKDAVARAPPENVPENICRAFLAETDGYWAGHYDIGRGARNLTACLIGRARAEEIAVNVLLPFCAALPHAAGLRQIAIEVFRAFPAGEDNAILRHMRRQTGLESVVMTARRQQGLLHVYKRFCTQGRCRSCLLKPERTAQA